MLFTIIRRNLTRNKTINIALLLFIILSAYLMVCGTIIIIQLTGSVDAIFQKARTPHFMQMHSGDYDQSLIDDFVNGNNGIDGQQTVQMVNMDSACIYFIKKDSNEKVILSDDMVDNGFVVQNPNFDYLLNLDDKVVIPEEGYLAVPVDYMERYNLELGDTIVIEDGTYFEKYIISDFIRDSQMAASMASSVRFLMNESDYVKLRDYEGEVEYIIEFFLKDSSKARDFQNEYETDARQLPRNGQGVTYNLVRLADSLADGITAAVIILVSFVLVIIAGINLRFTILATIEEEVREIGTMKAIGFLNKDVKSIYLIKYRILCIIGCVLGYLVAINTSGIFTKSITMTFGEQQMKLWQYFIPVLSVFLVYMLVIFFCRRTLKKIENVTVVGALVRGEMQVRKKKQQVNIGMPLEKSKVSSINLFMGFRELIIKFKTWIMLPIVFALALSIIVIPLNLLSTFSSSKFVTYMGSATCDVRIDLQEKELLYKKDEIDKELSADQNVSAVNTFATCNYKVQGEEGWETLRVECGDFSKFSVSYLKGTHPIGPNQIALSFLNAERFGVEVGSEIGLCIDGKELEYEVCGIYQDITYGGYTSKIVYDYNPDDVVWYTYYINLYNNSKVDSIADTFRAEFPYAKVTPIEDFVGQTFGTITKSLSKAVNAIIIVASLVTVLITVLFLRLQLAKDCSQNAILKAMGFSHGDLTAQYLVRTCIVGAIGIVLGLILANTLGEKLISTMFKILNMGLVQIVFLISPVKVFIMCPILIITVIVFSTYLSTADEKKNNIMQMIKE